MAVLGVTGNATEIRPALLDKVFNEYFTTEAPAKHIALGLALCRRLLMDSGDNIVIRKRFDCLTGKTCCYWRIIFRSHAR
jgi:C4-dicarboxylate-specific signal transduction histidine kinase